MPLVTERNKVIEITKKKERQLEFENISSSFDKNDWEKYHTDGDRMIQRNEERFRNTFFGGESFPRILYFGVSLAGAIGIGYKYGRDVWTKPLNGDIDSLLELEFDPETPIVKRCLSLLTKALEASKGNFYVLIPPLGGSGDIFSALYTPGKLCMALTDYPEKINMVESRFMEMWYKYYDLVYNLLSKEQEGSAAWLEVWAQGSTYPLQNDFSAMISPNMFTESFLPHIKEQTEKLDYPAYQTLESGNM